MLDPRAIPPPAQVATAWVKRRTFTAGEVPPRELLQAQKRAEGVRISVGIPTSNDAATIGPMCRLIRRELMLKSSLVDELLVLDADSFDESILQARTAGADVVHVNELLPEVTSHDGRGDVLWRGLTAMSGDIIVWLDARIPDLEPGVVERLVAPLLLDPTVGFVKGYHEAPVEFEVEIDNVLYTAGGERLTELLVRPLLNIFFPELGGFFQPLGRSYAARRELLRQIPFFSGCSVDVATLIDILDVVGLDGMAQAELGGCSGEESALDTLGPRAHAIARTILKRAEERKRIKLAPASTLYPFLVRQGKGVSLVRIDEVERPPIDVIPTYLAALDGRRDRSAADPRRSESIRA